MRRSKRGVWVGAWLTSAACSEPAPPNADPRAAASAPAAAAAEPEAPSPLPRPTEPAAFVGQHVLVPAGATLHLGPEAGAATVTLKLPAAAGERAPTPAVAMRVVGHAAERLELRPAAPERSCVPPLPSLASFDVAVWVEPQALARVLGRAVEAKFPDGTSVTLRPGVLVGPPGERVEVSASGLRLAVPLSEGDVSTLYAAEPLPVVPTGLRRLESGAPLTIAGGDPVLPESALVGGGLVLAQRTEGDRTFVRVSSGCAEVEAVVDPARLARPAGEAGAAVQADAGTEPAPATGRPAIRGPEGEPALARRGPTWKVEAGTPITWPSGAAAGTTVASHTFDVEPTPQGDRLCFSVALSEAAVAEAERLPLCLPASDVTREEDPLMLASSAGILGLMAAGPTDPSMFGGVGFGGSAELDGDVWGELPTAEIGEAYGVGGLGLSGRGAGGGGTGEGTLGLGDFGTLGHGAGGGSGSGYGRGRGLSGAGSDVEMGEPTVTGLDAKQASKVVARSRNQLRYCYEKGLLTNPTLAGTLALSLEIAAGAVTKAVATGDGLPEDLLRCVERSAKRWSVAGDGTLAVSVTLAPGA